jgi:succinate-semialdehyde dehydrogenase / glutarate-semialdehyde dehydrogenase
VLARAAALMRERSQELAALATLEMGKLIQQSLGEVALSAAILDYYAEHAEASLAPEKLNTRKGEAMVESSRSACCSAWSPGTTRTIRSRALPRPS